MRRGVSDKRERDTRKGKDKGDEADPGEAETRRCETRGQMLVCVETCPCEIPSIIAQSSHSLKMSEAFLVDILVQFA